MLPLEYQGKNQSICEKEAKKALERVGLGHKLSSKPQELAKQRAFSVRDALLAAGIAESRVKLQKPVQAEANLAGEDPAARRVEVTVK